MLILFLFKQNKKKPVDGSVIIKIILVADICYNTQKKSQLPNRMLCVAPVLEIDCQ